jgi:hypothetical protein
MVFVGRCAAFVCHLGTLFGSKLGIVDAADYAVHYHCEHPYIRTDVYCATLYKAHSQLVPFSRCMRYSISTSLVSGMTQSCGGSVDARRHV